MGRLADLDTDRLLAETGVTREELDTLAFRAEQSYKPRQVATTSNLRILLVPGRELRGFQRTFHRAFLRNHSYHRAVYCRRGRGALAAADRHKRRPYLLHLDVANFFPSVTVSRVRAVLSGVGVADSLVPMLTRLLTVRGELPQGAPTSTAIGNLVLFRVDCRVAELCRQKGLTYTRYVDDLAISGGSRLGDYEGTIRNAITECGWTLNERGRLYGPEDKHPLLGVVAGIQLTVGEEYLADLRQILAQARKGQIALDAATLAGLRGRVNWVTQVEPTTGRRLQLLLQAAAKQVP